MLVAQVVKRLPTMRETQPRSLGWEVLLEKEMVTYSGTFAWEISWTEERSSLWSMWSQRVSPVLSDFTFTFTLSIVPVIRASLVTKMVKYPPAVQETPVQSLGQEDPLEKGMATYSSIFAWEISWTEEPSGLPTMGS